VRHASACDSVYWAATRAFAPGDHQELLGAPCGNVLCELIMKSPDSVEKATLLAKASTADVYAWGVGHVLKLFHERTPWHANEVAAARVAREAHLPVPEVIGDLIEVGEREGIVFERVDGPTMTEYIEEHPDKVEYCAQQAAELHARIHSTEVTELPPLIEILSWSIQQADPLEERTRKAVLDVLNGLPAEGVLCHSDFYPNNIIVSFAAQPRRAADRLAARVRMLLGASHRSDF